MNYREMTLEVIKIACQDLIDRADDLVPDTDGIYDIDINLHIPSLTDDAACIPEVTLKIGTYSTRVASEKIFDLLRK